MPFRLSDDHVRALRMRAQRLIPQQPGGSSPVAQVVREACGIQAQDPSAAALAVRARSAGLVAADVEHARLQERSVVRTWGPRGTLHLLATADLDWLLQILGPVFVAEDRRRREELGLDEDTCVRAIRIIRDVLANRGALTRAELVEQLALRGIRLEGQGRPHLLGRAALEGVICLGPDRGAEPTYVLLSDWLDQCRRGPSLSGTTAHAELTRRYLGTYGPATPKDQAAWSGMPMNTIHAAWQHIADEIMEVKVAGPPAWMLKTRAPWLDEPPASTPIVRLLPRFDVYLLGYQNRDLAVPHQHAKRVNAGGGLLHPVVLVDGRVVGVWKGKRQKDRLNISVEPFEGLATELLPGLEAEITDIARFLEVQVEWHMLSPS